MTGGETDRIGATRTAVERQWIERGGRRNRRNVRLSSEIAPPWVGSAGMLVATGVRRSRRNVRLSSGIAPLWVGSVGMLVATGVQRAARRGVLARRLRRVVGVTNRSAAATPVKTIVRLAARLTIGVQRNAAKPPRSGGGNEKAQTRNDARKKSISATRIAEGTTSAGAKMMM